jgi:HAD superfamily hydrolase (TIGR01509 family)
MAKSPATPGVGAVIFDMDGLMFDTERLARDAWRAALADHGYALGDDVYLSVVGHTAQEARATFVAALGPDLPIDDVAAGAARRLRELLLPVPPLKPGLVALLDGIDDLRLALAVASSTAHAEVERRLVAAGLSPRFAAVVGGDEVARGKPAPDLFLLAGERLGVAPDRCLVLEDSEAGVRAAGAAGMSCVMVPDLVEPAPAVRRSAAAVVVSLSDVLAVLRPLVS